MTFCIRCACIAGALAAMGCNRPSGDVMQARQALCSAASIERESGAENLQRQGLGGGERGI